jgi:hypothetical protein
VVVLGVADPHHVVRREPQVAEGGVEPRGLVDARREDHHGPLVEDDLELQAHLPDDVEHGRLVRLPRRHDHPADRDRPDPARLEPLDELGRRRLGQRALLARVGPVEQGAVLGHHAVEDVELGEDVEQLVELAPGHQDQLPAGLLHPLQRLQGRGVDPAVVGESPVVVGREDVVAHER